MAIGECYEDGVGVEKSLETAFDYFKKAADIALKKGFSSPIYKLAKCYEHGIGLEKSLETAIYYYKIAGENGLIESYHQIGRCYHELGGEENEKKAAAYIKIAEAGKKMEIKEKVSAMKSRHGSHLMQQFFFIDKESAKQLETGKNDVELIFDSRKENFSSDTFLALQEERFGSYEDKNGRIRFKFPENIKI